jgi:hypothetical protein
MTEIFMCIYDKSGVFHVRQKLYVCNIWRNSW